MGWRRGNSLSRSRGLGGFTLVELLVVIGVIALLISITVPTLHLAQRQAQQAQCSANLQQLGIALENVSDSYDGFYPLWDDIGRPTRYTWIDLLVQIHALGDYRAGYCPADARPDPINGARGEMFGVVYPGSGNVPGIDYSYGISVTMSAGGWAWQPIYSPPQDPRRRYFYNHDEHPASRVLVADATWSCIYNLSGRYVQNGGVWYLPTHYDNTVAYQRHSGLKANFLKRDGHVDSVAYRARAPEPLDTTRHFVWYPGEPLEVSPEYPDPYVEGNYYPSVPPFRIVDGRVEADYRFPLELNTYYYTQNQFWTLIRHK